MKLYKVYAIDKNNCYVYMYSSMLDSSPVRLSITKSKFDDWIENKLDKRLFDGDTTPIQTNRQQVKETFTIKEKDKILLETIRDMVNKDDYILEKEIKIKKFTFSKIQEVMKNTELMNIYDLERVRANNQIKEDLRITVKGYPFLIVKKQH